MKEIIQKLYTRYEEYIIINFQVRTRYNLRKNTKTTFEIFENSTSDI